MGGVQILSFVLSIITLPYLAVTLGPRALGQMAFALSIAQIFTIITDYGFNLTGPKLIAKSKNNILKIQEIFIDVTLIRCCFGVVGLFFFILIFSVTLNSDLNIFLLAYFTVLGNIMFPQWLFQGLENLRALSMIQIAIRLASFISIIIFVHKPDDVAYAVFIQSSVFIFGGIIAAPLVYKHTGIRRISLPTANNIKSRLKENFSGFISMLSVSVVSSSNVAILGFMVSAEEVARYHVAEKLIRSIQIMYNPLIGALYPYTIRLAGADASAALVFNTKLIKLAIIIGLFISISVLFLSPIFLEFAFGARYNESINLLRWFSPFPLIIAISSVLGNLFLLPFGGDRSYGRVYLFSTFINFLFFPIAVSIWGAAGAVFVNIMIEALIAIGFWRSAQEIKLNLVK